jgi:hypothetical protein
MVMSAWRMASVVLIDPSQLSGFISVGWTRPADRLLRMRFRQGDYSPIFLT